MELAVIATRSVRKHQSHCHKERNTHMRAKIFKGTVLLITADESLETQLEEALLQAGYGIRITHGQEEAIEELRFMTHTMIVVDRRQSGFSRLGQHMPAPPPIMTVSYHTGQCDEQHCVM